MAVIQGWLLPLPGSGGLRDWSTFTTTFPGPNKGYMKVFAIESCCNTDPVIQPCDIFFVQGSNIVLMRDFGDTEVIATGSTQYVDIAELNGKLYARKFSGYLDEYTIGPSSLTLTTPDIVNINTGTSLASDGTYLIYDINSGVNSGKIARAVPGAWTETYFALPTTYILQGDILLVGGNQLAATVYDGGSKLLVFDNNPTTPTIQSESLIKDNVGNTISQIYSMFQKAGTLYIVRTDGTYYSMGTSWPIAFTPVAQLTIGGTTQGDWNGAAQNGDCGTVTPPTEPVDEGVSFDGTVTNNGIAQPGLYVSGAKMNDSYQTEMDSPTLDMTSSNTFNGISLTNSVGPYRVRFGNDPTSTVLMDFTIMANVDGAGFSEIDSGTLIIGQSYDNTFTITPTSSIVILVLVAKTPEVGYSIAITNDSMPAVIGVTLSDVSLKGISDVLIAEYVVDLDDVPPTDLHTGTGAFQEVDFQLTVGDIPSTLADIYISTDGAPDVFVATESMPNTSNYIKHFAQAAIATTSFKITYKFKQTPI